MARSQWPGVNGLGSMAKELTHADVRASMPPMLVRDDYHVSVVCTFSEHDNFVSHRENRKNANALALLVADVQWLTVGWRLLSLLMSSGLMFCRLFVCWQCFVDAQMRTHVRIQRVAPCTRR